MKKRKRRMVVWEVAIGDIADARPEDLRGGGVMTCNLPVRHTCFIESFDQTGLGERLKKTARRIGLEAGLSWPVIKGGIRVSEPIPAASEAIYRGLQAQHEPNA